MAEPQGTPSPESPPAAAPPAAAAAAAALVSVEALRAQLAAEFAAGLKAATGHESLSALKAAQDQAAADKLAEQGQFKQLAEQAQAQLGEVKAAYHAERIRGAVLAAATDAIDPETVRALLAGEAQVGSDGTVTIGGQTPAAAVAALLAAKPFLARPAGSAGSGSAGAAGAAGPSRAPVRSDYPSAIEFSKAAAKHAAQQG
ncbi:hypothetical protein [Lamprocystis purpurea]|jgi:hypothetical protein|uniref:hypothetical protein n=1 Tax=Lamprocystis purpurea TaxID=61598 RepID=UPI0003663BA7|nr:hypothetical protein [Lamprocystis purpurea]